MRDGYWAPAGAPQLTDDVRGLRMPQLQTVPCSLLGPNLDFRSNRGGRHEIEQLPLPETAHPRRLSRTSASGEDFFTDSGERLLAKDAKLSAGGLECCTPLMTTC